MSTFLPAIPVDLLDKVARTLTRVYLAAIPHAGDWVTYQASNTYVSFKVSDTELIGNAYATGHGSAYPAAVASGEGFAVSPYMFAALDHYGGGFPSKAEKPRKIVLRG